MFLSDLRGPGVVTTYYGSGTPQMCNPGTVGNTSVIGVSAPCLGTAISWCPDVLGPSAFSRTLREGVNNITYHAYDVVNHSSHVGTERYVDMSDPQLALSGPLYDRRGGDRTLGTKPTSCSACTAASTSWAPRPSTTAARITSWQCSTGPTLLGQAVPLLDVAHDRQPQMLGDRPQGRCERRKRVENAVLTMVAAGKGSHVANKASVAYRACLCTMS